MEQKNQICISEELPTLSSDYPWLVAHNLNLDEAEEDVQIFYTVHDPKSHYRCRVPELVGRRIRASFHGWMILSKLNPDNIEWSLWNPVISKLIRLPRLKILKDGDGDDFRHCCLSSPPDDPGSILLLMRSWSDWENRIEDHFFLKGSGTQLFTITLCVDKEEKPCDVYLFELDMSSMVWTQIKDLKDTVFFICLDVDDLVYSSPPIASELGGGYIHITAETGRIIYSFNIKDKTISMSHMYCLVDFPICSTSVWTMPQLRYVCINVSTEKC